MKRHEARLFDHLAQMRQAEAKAAERHDQLIAAGYEWDGMDGYTAPGLNQTMEYGIDLGHGPDKTFVTEYTRDADGTIHVHSVSECNGEDCGNQYTGGQEFR